MSSLKAVHVARDDAVPDDKGVRYVVLPPPKLKAMLLHQTSKRELMTDTWDNNLTGQLTVYLVTGFCDY